MKLLSPFVLLLCVESLHCSDDAGAIEPDSTENFFAKIKQFIVNPNLQREALKQYLKINYVAALKKQEEDAQFGVFFGTSCVIRDEVFDFRDFVHKHCKMVDTSPIHAPPEVIVGQLYNKSQENFLFHSYPKWLYFTDSSKSSLALCCRDKLSKKNHTTKQLAWSALKLYKFYSRYHNVVDSPAIVTFERYLVIRAAQNGMSNKGPQTLEFLPINTYAELKMFLSMTLEKKTFLDLLEEKNEWFVTSEDCQILNIIRQCRNKLEFECRPFKKSPNLVVPMFKRGHGGLFRKGCTPFL